MKSERPEIAGLRAAVASQSRTIVVLDKAVTFLAERLEAEIIAREADRAARAADHALIVNLEHAVAKLIRRERIAQKRRAA